MCVILKTDTLILYSTKGINNNLLLMLSNYNYYKLGRVIDERVHAYIPLGSECTYPRVVLVRLQYTLHGTVCLDKFNTS